MKRINYKDKLDEISEGVSKRAHPFFYKDKDASINLIVYLDGEYVENTGLSDSLFSLTNKLENDFSPILWGVCNV